MKTRRKLATPHLLGLDAGHPWWLTGAGQYRFPHTQPTGGGDGGGGAAGGGSGGTDGEPGSGSTDAGGAASGSVTSEDGDARWREHLSQADKKRAEAEKERDTLAAKLKEIEDKDKDELTKATERVQQLEQERQKDAEVIAKLRLENAFLTANDVQWHDPEEALTLARSGGYLEGVVKEDGTIDQGKLKTKLGQMAEKKKHLVKTTTETPPPGPSGAPLGSNGRGTTDNGDPDEAALKGRYRALRR